jgi:hypothetical protein
LDDRKDDRKLPFEPAELAVLAEMLCYCTVQIEHLSLKEVPGRLAAYPIYLADKQGKRRSHYPKHFKEATCKPTGYGI